MIRKVKGPYKCDICGGEIRNEMAVIKYMRGGGVYLRAHVRCYYGEGEDV